jgi:hypothetical protein
MSMTLTNEVYDPHLSSLLFFSAEHGYARKQPGQQKISTTCLAAFMHLARPTSNETSHKLAHLVSRQPVNLQVQPPIAAKPHPTPQPFLIHFSPSLSFLFLSSHLISQSQIPGDRDRQSDKRVCALGVASPKHWKCLFFLISVSLFLSFFRFLFLMATAGLHQERKGKQQRSVYGSGYGHGYGAAPACVLSSIFPWSDFFFLIFVAAAGSLASRISLV